MLLLRKYRLAAFFTLCGIAYSAPASPNQHLKRDPCVPVAQGFDALDDSPAINDALKACGNGGTIVLPADQIYSIRSLIDFSPCKRCDFQIEGQLVVGSGQWDYWNSVDSVFTLAGVEGARIRSVTGKGLIDGNAIDYYLSRWDSGFWTTKSFAHITNGSSDISIENLAFKNVMQRFFRAEGNSNNISFSNLKLSMEQQWGVYPRNEYDVAGIELGRVTSVQISNIDMSVKARADHAGPVGICVAIDVGTHNVTAQNLNCRGVWGGALVTLNSVGSITPTAAELLDTVSNVYVSNLTFDGNIATGFRSYGWDSTMKNIIWDGITIVNGNPASGSLCWLKSHSSTPYWSFCRDGLVAKLTDIWFRGFRGNLPAMPVMPGWEYINNKTVTEYHFVDWKNGTAE